MTMCGTSPRETTVNSERLPPAHRHSKICNADPLHGMHCSRRLMRIKMAERCVACIWRNTPTPSPPPERPLLPVKEPAAQPASSDGE